MDLFLSFFKWTKRTHNDQCISQQCTGRCIKFRNNWRKITAKAIAILTSASKRNEKISGRIFLEQVRQSTLSFQAEALSREVFSARERRISIAPRLSFNCSVE